MTTRTAASTTKELREIALHFYALKDVMRLEMVCVLAGREYTVNELAEALSKSQPLVSWHLRRLKAAGIVKIRRSGREVYCSLDRAVLAERQQSFLDLIGILDSGFRILNPEVRSQKPESNLQLPISKGA